MMCLLKILDNTFIGTFIAGIFLAFIGFSLYSKEKKTDIKYEDLRKIRESASLLLANIEIASKKYQEQIGIYNGGNTQLLNLSNKLNNKFDNRFRDQFNDEFNKIASKISELTETLIAQLKIEGGHDAEIKLLTEKTPALNIFLIGVSVLYRSKAEDIEQYNFGANEVISSIRITLQSLIKLK